ncbi:lysin A [Arthrobacter phage Qui]|uniref:Lysin A n=1 Tax=Arthrobacter phage Qui TaxID=2603260 RepID=A0A5B8WHL5_9CAUD|nr:lysin A [Arthrobacter phage Qui]QED11499.1 lysin A [Arthrobacter phage Qui]QOC56330.1 endolysin, protease M23 domain [Arthrobacter phage Paella]
MTDAYYLPFGPEVKLDRPFGVKPVDEWAAPAGEPIRAAGDGVVVFAGPVEDKFYTSNFAKNLDYSGDVVVLKMSGPTGPFFEYRNPSEIEVNSNDRVEAGQIIALAGEESTHVGALPWRFNLSSRTAGRVNPRLYQTEYWLENATLPEPEGHEGRVPEPTKIEEPAVATPKRSRRGSRTAEPVATEESIVVSGAIDASSLDAAPPAEPVDATLSDVAPPAAPIDSGVSSDD